jgi:RNA polymerase sigma-70 factor (ECF subfamily)
MPLDHAQILRALMPWRTRLSAAAWIVTRDAHAAEDIFQAVAVKAISTDVVFEAEAALVSWAFIAMRHAAIDWQRRRSREEVGIEAGLLDRVDAEWIERGPEGERLAALRECLERVPADSRRVLELRYADGLDCAEVAAAVGVGLDAVYKRLSRLHATLRQCVEGKLIESKGAIR